MPILLFLLSVLWGAAGAGAVEHFGPRLGLLDHPGIRSSHLSPTPKGGGIGILASFIFACLFLVISPVFWIPAAALAFLSLVGDRFEVSPIARLILQFAMASVFIWFSNPGLEVSIALFWMLVIFIVGTVNCYNFMDGINGIAGLTAIVGFTFLGIHSLSSGQDNGHAVLLICVACSCLGFLPFNMPGARVFMGDVGSVLLGFIFSAMVVLISRSPAEFICLAGLLFPFYADEMITALVRIKHCENLLTPHRRHLYQLLANEMGVRHWRVSLVYVLLQAIVGFCLLWALPFGIMPVISVLLAFMSAFAAANYIIRKKIPVVWSGCPNPPAAGHEFP